MRAILLIYSQYSYGIVPRRSLISYLAYYYYSKKTLISKIQVLQMSANKASNRSIASVSQRAPGMPRLTWLAII